MIKEIFTSIVIDNLTVNLRHLELENQRSNSTPIVILPGFGGIAEGFRDNMKSLFEAGYWPLVVDNLGFGGSDKPKDFNYSIKNLVRIIYRWIKKMELDQFIIVGTSLG
ncbi:MAG: alpha/beta fold hydrolase, partial [Candidatus Heimdallarchaeota archaeon]|nr:alpha/beta fold hydrolase [Candidatus Heimdallarchaeota archaeon]